MSWLFFAFDGRISREVYWLGIGLIWAILLSLIGIFADAIEDGRAGVMIIFVGVIALWAEIALLVKRLHDRDLPGFWALIAFLPFIGVLWMVLAGLMTGDAGANSYAPATNRRGAPPSTPANDNRD